MKIIIIGLPYFVSDLSAKFNRQDSDNTYIGLDTNGRRYDQLKFLWHIWSARIVYSIGGDYKKGGVFTIACILRKKMIMHWVGTDVLKARSAVQKGLIDQKFMTKVNHLSVVSWLRDELSDIDIDAKVKYIASYRGESIMKPLPDTFSVLTYIGAGREEFYGIEHIISLAKDFPELRINVAGIDVYKDPLPENIQLLGWVKDMDTRYNECTVFVRLPEHDGLGYSVIEALSRGRYVALSNSFPGTFYIQSYADLKNVIEDLLGKFRDKTLELNRKGFDFVQDHFEEKKVVKELIAFIKQC